MNIFLQILIMIFISVSFKSVAAGGAPIQHQMSSFLNKNGEVEQNQIDSVVAKATVKLGIQLDDNKLFWGMGVFVGPHTLMTVFHNISELKKDVPDQIFIVHPITKQRIPAKLIRALGFVNDLAVLHVEGYRSDFYITPEMFEETPETLEKTPEMFEETPETLEKTPEMFEDSTKSLASSHAYFFNRNKSFSPKVIGRVSPKNDTEVSFMKALFLPSFNQDELNELSGSLVLSMEGKIIGVLTGHENNGLHRRVLFTDIQSVKDILLRTPLNCDSGRCIQEELATNRHTKEAQYQQGMLEQQRLSSFVNLIPDENLKKDFIEGQKGLMYMWFRKSAYKGFPPAMYELAKLYLADQNIEKFNKWIKKAAENNHGEAQLHLSMYLLNQRGGFKEGMKWAQKAMEHGYFIPTLTLFNLVTEKVINMRAYLYYLEDFAKRGHLEAQVELALYLFTGDTVVKDIKKAMKLLLQAVKANDPKALKYLSHIYKEGLYEETQDIEKAERLEQKAREFGYVDIKDREVKPITDYIRGVVSNITHVRGFQRKSVEQDGVQDGMIRKIISRVQSAADKLTHDCQRAFGNIKKIKN